MLLVADVGNTHTVLGFYRREELLFKWNIKTDAERTVDEWGLEFKALFDLAGVDSVEIGDFAICSVVPPSMHSLKHASRKYLDIEPLIVEPGVKTGLSLRYDNPREIGSDRVVNAVAALEKYKSGCIIIDFGTATTFDCLSSKGEYLGGVICPGIGISLEALVTHAAKLPEVAIARPPNVIGKTTEHAMQSGILFGYASMVDGLVERLKEEMAIDLAVIATGGLSSVIMDETELVNYTEPNLTLEGLRIIYDKNSQRSRHK